MSRFALLLAISLVYSRMHSVGLKFGSSDLVTASRLNSAFARSVSSAGSFSPLRKAIVIISYSMTPAGVSSTVWSACCAINADTSRT